MSINFIESLQSYLQGELENLPLISKERCIYHVPHHLQMANELGAYTPLVVSIGPLHHNDAHLLRNQVHKLKYLKSFLDRSQETSSRDLKDYLKLVAKQEGKIRNCYADPKVAQVESGELIMMVLVDAAFLIELFGRGEPNNWVIEEDDQMFNNPRMVVEVSQDIRLAENQLPFFILEELYNAAGFNQPNAQKTPPSFLSSACESLKIRTPPAGQYKHLLDLVRTDFLPSNRREQRGKNNGTKKSNIDVCKSATALREAGVKFTVNKDPARPCGLLDIKFNTTWCRGTLSIPKVVVQDDTEALFKNLAVFEQCHYFEDSYIIDYITFMDFLINTEEDVELLVKHGIIEHWLGSNSRVADMFNGLSKHLRLRSDNFYYATLCTQLDDYYNRPCNHHLAVLRQKYFNHPWATISVVYAILLLFLTVLQAATGVIQVLPKKS